MGAASKRGKGVPQSAQEVGSRTHPSASRGLRSTRATARQRAEDDGGSSTDSEPESLRKTHLTWSAPKRARRLWGKYTRKTPWNRVKTAFIR
jgi:hypothetical protein